MLAVTPGEPAGVGPDLVVRYAQTAREYPLVVFADREMLTARAVSLGVPLKIEQDLTQPTLSPGALTVAHQPLARPAVAGQLDPQNVPAVMQSLNQAIDGCLNGTYSALVTGPMQKSVVNEAGIAFSGHTEYLAQRAGVEKVVMLLVAGQLRVALATTHLPLADVAQAIEATTLRQTISILRSGLQHQFGLDEPRLLVAGLNPHAGESGHLGREEIDVIQPVCDELRESGAAISGPLPADTLFTPRHLEQADAVLAMYHDQGLPVLKYAGFGEAVNVTLGLPFVRTSVDHGTALDIAGTEHVDSGSFGAAMTLASQLNG